MSSEEFEDMPVSNGPNSLAGQFLIAMPTMGDPRFERTLIYVCAHGEDGAMGLVVNKPVEDITFPELLDQLGIETGRADEQIRVYFGGPVESTRGFVLHTSDYFTANSTLQVSSSIGLTATIDILKAMAHGQGPTHSLLALGYAGWGPGQLEDEMVQNGWLTCPADPELVFTGSAESKWARAMAKIGIDPALLSSEAGRA